MAHKRQLQLITLVFISDFGSKKSGDEDSYNTMMASDIIRKGVAVVKETHDEQKPVKPDIKKPKNKK